MVGYFFYVVVVLIWDGTPFFTLYTQRYVVFGSCEEWEYDYSYCFYAILVPSHQIPFDFHLLNRKIRCEYSMVHIPVPFQIVKRFGLSHYIEELALRSSKEVYNSISTGIHFLHNHMLGGDDAVDR